MGLLLNGFHLLRASSSTATASHIIDKKGGGVDGIGLCSVWPLFQRVREMVHCAHFGFVVFERVTPFL